MAETKNKKEKKNGNEGKRVSSIDRYREIKIETETEQEEDPKLFIM